ncbi:hypothetical protein M0812_02317 [Anaeramoeba flamelloides]|uniref:CUE domain-containing protein n=1 Tax=Anaeramoeba flamelloides TaxID=1746091 RepID=A0AAV7Z232_9EUKA|nr:hypothetical protein M0812_02317 [Anaeramoeba flamelloides]
MEILQLMFPDLSIEVLIAAGEINNNNPERTADFLLDPKNVVMLVESFSIQTGSGINADNVEEKKSQMKQPKEEINKPKKKNETKIEEEKNSDWSDETDGFTSTDSFTTGTVTGTGTEDEGSDKFLDESSEEFVSEDNDELFDIKQDSKVLGMSKFDPKDYDKRKSFLPPTEEVKGLLTLNPRQTAVMKYVVSVSKKKSEQAYFQVLDKLKTMKFYKNDLDKTLVYIRDVAPVIIHFRSTIFDTLLNDTHYRNCFEINKQQYNNSSGGRVHHESQLFNNIYEKFGTQNHCTPFERPKYGSLNIVKDQKGVKCCSGYGECYMELKGVKLRTTFANQDSFSTKNLASCEYYCHVLSEFNENELRAIVEVGTGRVTWKDSAVIASYKECQIHGPVKLSENIKVIAFPNNLKSKFSKKVQEFSFINNCTVRWF